MIDSDEFERKNRAEQDRAASFLLCAGVLIVVTGAAVVWACKVAIAVLVAKALS